MKLKELEYVVFKTLERNLVEPDGDLSVSMLKQAADKYELQYGYVPEAWLRIMGGVNRFRSILHSNGYGYEELDGMTVLELRDAVGDLEYVQKAKVNKNGTVTKWKESLKKAA